MKLNGDRISHWAKGPPITVNVGSFLRILESFAFAGLFGTVTAIDDEAREIDAVGRMVPLRLQPEQVELRPSCPNGRIALKGHPVTTAPPVAASVNQVRAV